MGTRDPGMDEFPDDGNPALPAPPPLEMTVTADLAGTRLDRALGSLVPAELALSRSRLAVLIAEGHVLFDDGRTVAEPARKVKEGERYRITLPAPEDPEPRPEDIPLTIVHEDAHLVVVDKPAGMVVHPAPGAPNGTLVNALLHHCGDSLSGIGGVRRPGIVHRIDKETSGLLVCAKTDAAHQGLAVLFAQHDVERVYLAICHGVPNRADPRLGGLDGVSFEAGGTVRIETLIDRHPTDRKRMAVTSGRGRRAITRLRVAEAFGTTAALLECRLETGRTHQIRVHAAYTGHALIGDPIYGGRRKLPGALDPSLTAAIAGFPRQALHAARLGFVHPVTGASLSFSAPMPEDLANLANVIRHHFP